ncbi:MAG: vWA domain-containing protein [Pirellulales bacterium]
MRYNNSSAASRTLKPAPHFHIPDMPWYFWLSLTMLLLLGGTTTWQSYRLWLNAKHIAKLQSELLTEKATNSQLSNAISLADQESKSQRDRIKSLASQHLTRLSQFADFVHDDPQLSKRVLIEAMQFAEAESLDVGVVQAKLTGLATPARLPQGTSARLLDQSIDGNSIQLSVEVTNAAGGFIPKLSRVDFDLQCNGKTVHPVRVVESSMPTGDHFISVLIDCSSSISSQELDAVKRAAKKIIQQLANPWQCRVTRFATDVRALTPFSFDASIHALAIDQLTADGATALNEAIRLECAELQNHHGARSMIVFTDGNDSSGLPNLTPIFQQCREQSIRCFVVALNKGAINEPILRSIATETNGTYQSINSVDKLEGTFDSIASSLKRPVYRVTALGPLDPNALVLKVGPCVAQPIEDRSSFVLTKNGSR